jgi:DNA-binding response OmpR family regulator
MPKMNRLELLQRLRNSGCEVPVIVVTGKLSLNSEDYYLGKGANGFFRKPVDGQALVTFIDRLLTPPQCGS